MATITTEPKPAKAKKHKTAREPKPPKAAKPPAVKAPPAPVWASPVKPPLVLLPVKARGLTPPADIRHRVIEWDAKARRWRPRPFALDAPPAAGVSPFILLTLTPFFWACNWIIGRGLASDIPPMADWLESFVPMRLHVLVRFGLWEDIIDEPLPEDAELYSFTTALTHYAKGVAHAATQRVDEAERERDSFAGAVARVPESRYLFNNQSLDILAVAAAMLDGEIEYRKGNYNAAWTNLRRRRVTLAYGFAGCRTRGLYFEH